MLMPVLSVDLSPTLALTIILTLDFEIEGRD